jgi:hypothetical protein
VGICRDVQGSGLLHLRPSEVGIFRDVQRTKLHTHTHTHTHTQKDQEAKDVLDAAEAKVAKDEKEEKLDRSYLVSFDVSGECGVCACVRDVQGSGLLNLRPSEVGICWDLQ